VSFLWESLQRLHPQLKYKIFSKHDTSLPPETPVSSNTILNFSGAWPLALRTPVFASKIIGYGLWQRPSLVIATHLNFTVAAYWLKRFAGVPYWAVAHGVEAWNINQPDLQIALHHADRILAVSGYTRDRLLKEQNLDPAKISLLPNTFDASCFQIDPKPTYLLKRYGLSPKQPIILTVARLSSAEQYKGYDQVIQSLPAMIKQIPNVHYLLVGKGDDLPRVEALIQDLNLQSYVTLAGFIPDEELSDHYNLCDVFAMPSKGEGFGIVYLEALACGKPTLGGDRDGAIDALCHGELGALVDPDDVSGIAKTLIQILQGTYPHPIMYQPQVLRQKAIDVFGFERFQQTLAELMKTADIGV
jgi:glycosyltransferase involved in cell wall biosynthesis